MNLSGEAIREMQRDIRILKDIEAVKRVKHAYFRCIDTANIEELKTLFHKNVEVYFIGGTYVWELHGRDEYLEAIAANFNANVIAQHNGHHPEIDILSETEATGIWYLHDNFYRFADMHYVQGTALYRDRYVKEDGRWQIIESRYERIYEIDQVMTERPPVTAQYIAKTGRKPSGTV
jgi:hypothetical protein